VLRNGPVVSIAPALENLLVLNQTGANISQVFYGTYGGAVCTFDAVNSFINPTTCETQIITIIQ
jgi:hypothetical protein